MDCLCCNAEVVMLNTELPKARVKSNLGGQATTNKKDIIFPFSSSFLSHPFLLVLFYFVPFFLQVSALGFVPLKGLTRMSGMCWWVYLANKNKQTNKQVVYWTPRYNNPVSICIQGVNLCICVKFQLSPFHCCCCLSLHSKVYFTYVGGHVAAPVRSRWIG